MVGARIPTAATTARTVAQRQPQVDTFRPKDYTGWSLQQAQDWKKQMETEIGRRPQGADNFQRHLADVDRYIGLNFKNPATGELNSSGNGINVNNAPVNPAASNPTGQPNPTAAPSPSIYTPPDTLDRPQAVTRYQEAAHRLKTLQKGTPEYERNAQILYGIGSKYGFRWQDQLGADYKPGQLVPQDPAASNPVTQDPAASAGPVDTSGGTVGGNAGSGSTEPTTTTPYDWSNYQSPMTKALLEAFASGSNTMRANEPQFFEGSPMYQFQKEQGQKDLSKLLAARGLTGSGAEVTGYSDFLQKLGAEEADKQRQYADKEADRRQAALQYIADYDKSERETLRNQANVDTDRGINLSQFDATRNDAWRAQQLNTLMGILGLQAQTSPLDLIYKGMGDQAGVYGDIGKLIANYQANNYNRALPSGGRGGGSGASQPLPPMRPNDPTQLDIARILAGAGNRADNNGVFNSILNLIPGLVGNG